MDEPSLTFFSGQFQGVLILHTFISTYTHTSYSIHAYRLTQSPFFSVKCGVKSSCCFILLLLIKKYESCILDLIRGTGYCAKIDGDNLNVD